MAFSSMTVETELGTVSTSGGAPETVTVSRVPAQGEAELEVEGTADLNVDLRGQLGGHIFHLGAGGVVAGREEFEGEAAVGIGRGAVGGASGEIDEGDGGGRERSRVGIEDGAADRAGGGVLRVQGGSEE